MTVNTWNVTSGATLYAGRNPPSGGGGMPAWLNSTFAVNEWHPIPNTLGSDSGAPLDQFSGFVLVGTRIIAALSGGHEYSTNATVGIELNVPSPAWPTTPLNPSSTTFNPKDTTFRPYEPDGKPRSRHTRFNGQWMPGVRGGRVMMLGARDTFGIGPPSGPTVDGFNLSTNAWDAGGTYPSIPAGVTNGGACVDDNGDGWVNNNAAKFTASTETWSTPLTSTAPNAVRYPWCNAVGKGYMFGLCWGNGWGSPQGASNNVNAVKHVGNVQTQITFAPSAALDQFIADAPYEAGMDYDQVNDCFLFFGGVPAGRVYRVIPNNGTVWDMQIVSYGTGNVMPASTGTAGMQSRFKYIAAFKGFVCLPTITSNLLFMRTLT